PDFLQAVRLLKQHYPELQVVIPAANELRKQEIKAGIQAAGIENMLVLDGQSRTVMAAADVLMMASGTATLEGALYKKPMVVGYRLGPITYWLLSLLIRVKHVYLPNLLCATPLITELIQHNMPPARVCAAVLIWFQNPAQVSAQLRSFTELHPQLRQNASVTAAQVVRQFIAVPQ